MRACREKGNFVAVRGGRGGGCTYNRAWEYIIMDVLTFVGHRAPVVVNCVHCSVIWEQLRGGKSWNRHAFPERQLEAARVCQTVNLTGLGSVRLFLAR